MLHCSHLLLVDKVPDAVKTANKPYMETDVDTMFSRDISVRDGPQQGEGDWQSTPPVDVASLHRTTAIDNISSATYTSPSSIPHADHSEAARQNVPRTFLESDGTPEIERRHVPRTYRDESGTPEMERRHVPLTYRDESGTPEMERRHVPRTYRDESGTPEMERRHVPRTYRDESGTPEIERHHVPRTYRDESGTPEMERRHVPRTYRDESGTPEIERHHVPRTYDDGDKPLSSRGRYLPETEERHVPRTYNRTAPPFGSDMHSVRPGLTSVQIYESGTFMNGDTVPPAGHSKDQTGSSRWQPSQTSEWQDSVSYTNFSKCILLFLNN